MSRPREQDSPAAPGARRIRLCRAAWSAAALIAGISCGSIWQAVTLRDAGAGGSQDAAVKGARRMKSAGETRYPSRNAKALWRRYAAELSRSDIALVENIINEAKGRDALVTISRRLGEAGFPPSFVSAAAPLVCLEWFRRNHPDVPPAHYPLTIDSAGSETALLAWKAYAAADPAGWRRSVREEALPGEATRGATAAYAFAAGGDLDLILLAGPEQQATAQTKILELAACESPAAFLSALSALQDHTRTNRRAVPVPEGARAGLARRGLTTADLKTHFTAGDCPRELLLDVAMAEFLDLAAAGKPLADSTFDPWLLPEVVKNAGPGSGRAILSGLGAIGVDASTLDVSLQTFIGRELPAEEREQCARDGSLPLQLRAGAAQAAILYGDPGAAERMLDLSRGDPAMRNIVMASLITASPSTAWSLSGPDTPEATTQNLFRWWFRNDPERAFMAGTSSGGAPPESFTGFFKDWLKQDSWGVSNFVNTLPGGEPKRWAGGQLSAWLTDSDPEAAAEWEKISFQQ